MNLINKGVTRLVILIGNYAIKIPNFTCQHSHFLQGCYANWSERQYTKMFRNLPEIKKVAPTYFCSWFGLVSVQARVIELNRHLTNEEREYFKHQTDDIKSANFGFLNGNLVCIDYV